MNPELSGYNIVRVTKNLLEDLIPLYKEVLQKEYSIEHLQKKFDTESFGAEYIGYVAYWENKAIAFYAIFPCLMEYKEQNILAAQSADTMTHPEHRGKGLFVHLAKTTFELARIEGIKFVFGFPNANSYGSIKILPWEHEEDMNLYKIKVNTLPLANLGMKNHFFKTPYLSFLQFIMFFHKKTKVPINIFPRDNDSIHIKHDANYFNYKSYGNSFKLNIANVNIWMRVNGELLVGDLEYVKDENIKPILKHLKRFAFLIGCRRIIFCFSKGMFWDRQLAKYFTAEKGFSIFYYDLSSGLPLTKLAFSFSALDTF